METERKMSMLPHARVVLGLAVTVGVSLTVFALLLRPPAEDIVLMAAIFVPMALVSHGALWFLLRFSLLERSPRFAWTLISTYGALAALVLLTVWPASLLMFVSRHDFRVTLVLLLFAVGVTLTLGWVLSQGASRDIERLRAATSRVAAGELPLEVPVSRRDEVGELADSFSTMTAELAAVREEREELDRVRRNLLAWAGHDLRNPLGSAAAIVQAMEEGAVEDPATAQRYLSYARRDLARVSRMIDDLPILAHAGLESLPLNWESVQVGKIVAETVESWSLPADREKVQVSCEVARLSGTVSADAGWLRRLLDNLLENAIRHTPPGGEVRVRVGRAGDEVTVAVEDTGEGIPEDVLSHLFEPPSPLREVDRLEQEMGSGGIDLQDEAPRPRIRRGARRGFGLAIAQSIATAHGRRIWAEKRAGGGAVLAFALPTAPADREGGRESEGRDPSDRRGEGAGWSTERSETSREGSKAYEV